MLNKVFKATLDNEKLHSYSKSKNDWSIKTRLKLYRKWGKPNKTQPLKFAQVKTKKKEKEKMINIHLLFFFNPQFLKKNKIYI